MLRFANYSLTKRILANFTQALAFLLNTSFCQENVKKVQWTFDSEAENKLRWFGGGASKRYPSALSNAELKYR